MANQEVKREQTPVSEAEMSRAILNAAQKLFGISLTKKQLSLLIAQNNLETGNRKSMWNYNVGNITHVNGDGFDYWTGLDWLYTYMPDASGFTKEQRKTVKLKYRAYPSLEAGVEDYLKFLKKKGGGSIWQKILEGDPAEFSKELKRNKYYTAHEEDYTKGLVAHVNAFNKRKSYEEAISNQTSKPTTDILSRIDNLLNNFLNALAESPTSSHFKKKALYKKKLPPHNYLIKIKSANFEDSIEFARILNLAIDEELYSNAYTYTDRNEVEVECTIHGPRDLCTQALLQLCDGVSHAFEKATQKIGGCKVKSIICIDKKSNYQELDIKLAQMCYNNFHLKFIK